MVEVPKYTRRQLVKRYCLLGVGIYIMTIGIAMSKLAGLGTTPISCIPASCSYFTPLSMGMVTIIFNAILVLIEVIVLGKQFRPVQYLQIVMALFIGVGTDVNLALFSFIDPQNYFSQWFFCILSALILGFGVMLEVRANVLVAPGEGIVVAFVTRYKVPFPKMKTISDSSMVITGAVLSLVFSGALNGVREGTIFAALAVGTIVGFYRKHLGSAVDRLLA